MTRTTCVLFAFVLAAATAAAAQEPPPPQNPPVQNPPPPPQNPPPPPQNPPAPSTPTQAPSIAPATALPEDATLDPMMRARFRARRNAIGIFEQGLAAAVSQGATDVVSQIKERYGQSAAFTMGKARARGFILEDYGVLFHVEIPAVRGGVATLLDQFEQERQRNLGRAERLGERAQMPFDANLAYTEAVKNALVDMMLTYSVGLDLGPAEWLTIAARDLDEPAAGAIVESITMVIRVRGADLADFHAKRLSREDVLRRVQIRGF